MQRRATEMAIWGARPKMTSDSKVSLTVKVPQALKRISKRQP